MLGKLMDAIGLKRSTQDDGSSPRRLPTEYQHLLKSLQILTHIDAAWPQRAFDFVAHGSDPQILIDLGKSAANASELLGKPGRLYGNLWLHKNPLEKDIKAALKQRSQFHQGKESTPDQLVRLGKLLACADQGKSLQATGAPIPDWLQYLLADALGASFDTYNPAPTAQDRPLWNVGTLHALLQSEEQPGTLALQAVFECKDLNPYHHKALSRLHDDPDLPVYLRQHAEAVRLLPTQLSAEGRLKLVQVLGSHADSAQAFADLLVRMAVNASKTVRAEALRYLDAIAIDRRTALLEGMLRDGDGGERERSAELISLSVGASGRPLLEAAATTETSKTVQQAIRAALNRLTAADDVKALPPPPSFDMPNDAPLGEEILTLLRANRVELLEKLRQSAEEEIEQNKTQNRKWNYRQKTFNDYKAMPDSALQMAIEVLNGTARKVQLNTEQVRTLDFSQRLTARPELGITHLVRWLSNGAANQYSTFWQAPRFQQWLIRQDLSKIDLRMFAAVLRDSGQSITPVAGSCLRSAWSASGPQSMLPPERIWPFFAEHPDYIDEGLGLKPQSQERYRQFSLEYTMQVLATFPVLQPAWVARLMTIALAESKTHRPQAQQVLASKLPDIGQRIVESLSSSKQEIRIVASEWLAELGYREAVPAVRAALDKETRETVRASLMTTLEHLGEDITPMLAAKRLEAEARKGLKAKPPAGLAWFPLGALPACRWAQDGSPVAAEVIQWWVVLACKLKEPAGNALLDRYLGLLDEASRVALGGFVLRQFIDQDTRHPSVEEASAHANAGAQQRLDMYLRWAKHSPAYADYTLDRAFEELKREKLKEYLGSAIAEKGVLALISGAAGHELVSLIQAYMRDHYTRRSQVEAMLMGASRSADPLVIQLLLSVSRRHRTRSVQELARQLVEAIAERNHWTQDQLADRTVPTAGFDESGMLTLDYGSRVLTVTLDAAMKPLLKNADGKVLKALPDARQDDDAEKAKEAKAQFSATRKELKQAIDLQTARLYEAMCGGRVWPAAEWTEYLLKHPIMSRLVQRLVWQIFDADGTSPRECLRPTEDGSLIDATDNEVTLPADGHIRLAHAALVDTATAKAWTAHLKDYQVAPLFAQMSRSLPDMAKLSAESRVIEDRLGWLSDAFTLRGAFNKLGYQRGQGEDGGFFGEYAKEFASSGLRVVIEFSGNTLPEENVTAVLKGLSYEKLGVRNFQQRHALLSEVPPVLLAETYGDYLAIAKVCSGFDADWEKKTPW